MRSYLLTLVSSVIFAIPLLAAEPGWEKITLDKKFRSEGVAVADVNKDGKKDIISGDYWYEAPDWKQHEIRPCKKPDGYDPTGYSDSFAVFTDDFNNDGWDDVLVIGFPGKPCFWYENPKNEKKHWKERQVWRSACNETPQFVELFGDGKKYLVMSMEPEFQMAWFSVPKDIDAPAWDMHPISSTKSPGTAKFAHGLGAGDINGDGRTDVIIPEGWWEQPADAKTRSEPWTFHKTTLGAACADMYAVDLDNDGLADVISSSAHQRGIWWHKQLEKGGAKFKPSIKIFEEFTQTHAMVYADINGDGKKDLVTGKRWWAHGPKGDVDPMAPAVIYWFDITKSDKPTFTPYKVDDDSGIGTQFVVTDVNGDGKPDIVLSNKKGVHLLVQKK